MEPKVLASQSPKMSWFIVGLGIITALGPLSIDMYLPAFDDISKSLSVSIASVQYSLASFFIGLSLGQLFYGPIADRFGRKRPLQFGLLIYALASVGCALANSIEALICLRAMQALGGSAGSVISRAMVRDRYDPSHAARVFSLIMLILAVAPILAPIAGGYITVHYGWRNLFWILSVFSSLFCILSFFMPETHPHEKRTKILSFKSVLHVYMGIFKDRKFVGYALSGGMAMAGVFSYIAGSSFVFINLYGIPKEHFGWFFGTNAFGMITVSQINSRILAKYPFEKVLKFAITFMLWTGIYLVAVGFLSGPLFALAPGLLLYISMLGFIMPNSTAGALANQAKHAGAASALAGTMQFIFGAGSSYLVSILYDGTARPMVIGMFVCSLISWLSYRFFVTNKAK